MNNCMPCKCACAESDKSLQAMKKILEQITRSIRNYQDPNLKEYHGPNADIQAVYGLIQVDALCYALRIISADNPCMYAIAESYKSYAVGELNKFLVERNKGVSFE